MRREGSKPFTPPRTKGSIWLSDNQNIIGVVVQICEHPVGHAQCFQSIMRIFPDFDWVISTDTLYQRVNSPNPVQVCSRTWGNTESHP